MSVLKYVFDRNPLVPVRVVGGLLHLIAEPLLRARPPVPRLVRGQQVGEVECVRVGWVLHALGARGVEPARKAVRPGLLDALAEARKEPRGVGLRRGEGAVLGERFLCRAAGWSVRRSGAEGWGEGRAEGGRREGGGRADRWWSE